MIWYISDHGDCVYDYFDFIGHSEAFGYPCLVEIPSLIYMSDIFKQNHKDIAARVESALDKPFMSDNFMHAFLDLLGVENSWIEKQNSIFSPNFNEKRERVFANRAYSKNNYFFEVPESLWLHRVDDIKKLKTFLNKYRNIEIDVHFLDNYFDVGHDGAESSINLNLISMLKTISNRNEKLGINSRIWLDFKNLDSSNAKLALKELQRIKPKNIDFIIESSSYENLLIFRANGFYTSYYVPYYKKSELIERHEIVKQDLIKIAHFGDENRINALSFPEYLYDFIMDIDFGREIDFLAWNETQDWKQNLNHKGFGKNLSVILVGEKGDFR